MTVFLPSAERVVGVSGTIVKVSVGIVPRVIPYPRSKISLSGSEVPEKVLISSIRAVPSYVSDRSFVSGELLTKDSLDELKANLPVAHIFMSNSSFAPCRLGSA